MMIAPTRRARRVGRSRRQAWQGWRPNGCGPTRRSGLADQPKPTALRAVGEADRATRRCGRNACLQDGKPQLRWLRRGARIVMSEVEAE